MHTPRASCRETVMFKSTQTLEISRTLHALMNGNLHSRAATLFGIVRRRRPSGSSDLGWVTEQWLAEHRADQSAVSR
jgi:hypothetical protein